MHPRPGRPCRIRPSRVSNPARGTRRARALPVRAFPRRSRRAPGKPNGCCRVGRNAFAIADRAELFVGSRLHADAVERNAGDLGDAPAHRVTMRIDLWGFADDRHVEVAYLSASRSYAF